MYVVVVFKLLHCPQVAKQNNCRLNEQVFKQTFSHKHSGWKM